MTDIVRSYFLVFVLAALVQVPCILAEPASGQSTETKQAGFPMWAIVILAILASVIVTVAMIYLIRKAVENMRKVHADTRKSTMHKDSVAVDEKAGHLSFPVSTPSTPGFEDDSKKGNARRSSSADSYPLEEICISLPMPPVSTSLFSDKLELSSEEATELYKSYMNGIDDPGIVSIDHTKQSQQPYRQKIQKRAATLRSTLRLSLRRQRSTKQPSSSSPPPLAVYSIFPESEPVKRSPSRRSSTSSRKSRTSANRKTLVETTPTNRLSCTEGHLEQSNISPTSVDLSHKGHGTSHDKYNPETMNAIETSVPIKRVSSESTGSRPQSILAEAASRRLEPQNSELLHPPYDKPTETLDDAQGPMPSPSEPKNSRWSKISSRSPSELSLHSTRPPSTTSAMFHGNVSLINNGLEQSMSQQAALSPASSRRSSVQLINPSPVTTPFASIRGADRLRAMVSGQEQAQTLSRQSSIRTNGSIRGQIQPGLAKDVGLPSDPSGNEAPGSPQGSISSRPDSKLGQSQRRSILSTTMSVGTSSTRSSIIHRSPPSSLTPRQQHLISLSMRAQQHWQQRPAMPEGFMVNEQDDPVPTVSFSSSTVRTMIPEDEYSSSAAAAAAANASSAIDPRGSYNGRSNAIVNQTQRAQEPVRETTKAAPPKREQDRKIINTVRGTRQQPRGSIPWMQTSKQTKTPAQRERDRYLKSLK